MPDYEGIDWILVYFIGDLGKAEKKYETGHRNRTTILTDNAHDGNRSLYTFGGVAHARREQQVCSHMGRVKTGRPVRPPRRRTRGRWEDRARNSEQRRREKDDGPFFWSYFLTGQLTVRTERVKWYGGACAVPNRSFYSFPPFSRHNSVFVPTYTFRTPSEHVRKYFWSTQDPVYLFLFFGGGEGAVLYV